MILIQQVIVYNQYIINFLASLHGGNSNGLYFIIKSIISINLTPCHYLYWYLVSVDPVPTWWTNRCTNFWYSYRDIGIDIYLIFLLIIINVIILELITSLIMIIIGQMWFFITLRRLRLYRKHYLRDWNGRRSTITSEYFVVQTLTKERICKIQQTHLQLTII